MIANAWVCKADAELEGTAFHLSISNRCRKAGIACTGTACLQQDIHNRKGLAVMAFPIPFALAANHLPLPAGQGGRGPTLPCPTLPGWSNVSPVTTAAATVLVQHEQHAYRYAKTPKLEDSKAALACSLPQSVRFSPKAPIAPSAPAERRAETLYTGGFPYAFRHPTNLHTVHLCKSSTIRQDPHAPTQAEWLPPGAGRWSCVHGCRAGQCSV